ncbi:amino acid transporter AVT3B-like [Silene latifolia]|uniref:amino acid transporter AVT3B-like n=1 Tax=Silene latifolia TaxID=37657 RepID=UPI003D76B4CD
MGFGKNNNEAGSSSSSIKIAREDTPLIAKPKQSSQFKTLANIFIAIVGSGVLGLPYTFMRSGWIFGVVTLFCVAMLTYYCMLLLVSTRRKLESLNGYSKINSFGDLGYSVCGSFGRSSVDLMIILSQAGFCVSYMIFVANTIAHVFMPDVQNQSFLGLTPKKWFLWCCLPFQLGLNSIPTLTHLAPLSIFADVVQIGAMGVVMAKDVVVIADNRPIVQGFGGWNVLFYCVGVCTYAFEGIGMVLPLETEAKDKKSFGKTLGISMGMISFLYGAFGALGYFAFGDETKDIITTNIGTGIVSTLVQLGLCINLFFTFPLMMNPVYEVLERRLTQGSYSLWARWLTVLGVTLVALMVPNFADFLSLVGSSVCIALGFVFPSLFHFIVFKDEVGWGRLILDGAIVVIGIVLGVSGTYSSLMEIFASKA